MSVAALPLVTGGWLAIAASPAAADDSSGGPRYTYLDAGYQWVDSNYAVQQAGGQHEGFKVAASMELFDTGRVGLHLFGELFDGDFKGVRTSCDGGEGGPTSFSGKRSSQSLVGGLGVNFGVTEKTDIVVRGAYVDISKFETPNNLCQLVSGDDHGYFGEVTVRSEMSDKVEIEAGFRYSDLTDSKVSNNDVLLGIGYHLTDYLTLRARGVVFDSDTGLEIGARLYFGSFMGRDSVF
ncbi:MAG: outer membrane beta-barrel protein [Gammaproteobacteria bacterium]